MCSSAAVSKPTPYVAVPRCPVHGVAYPRAMEVYRAPLWSRRDDVDPELALDRALGLGLVGMGGRLSRAPHDLADALALLSSEYDERMARRVERFAAVTAGAQVWTRDRDGRYRRGRLAGAWRYDPDPAALAADLVHVRDADWDEESLDEHRTPAPVVATFARGGRNFQRIHAAG